MPISPLDIGYAYDSHLSYLDHLRLADSAREAGAVASDGAERGARRIEAGIAAAASKITDAVHEVSSEMRAAREVMEWGFSAMLDEMAEMRTTLKELLKCVREPSRTWAYEQFEIARDNFTNPVRHDDCSLSTASDGGIWERRFQQACCTLATKTAGLGKIKKRQAATFCH